MAKMPVILAFIFVVNGFCTAQKTIQKEFFAEEISIISIEDDAISRIEIFSSEEATILVTAHISGENAEYIVVDENIQNGKLSLKTGFAPFFTLKNDKLAAHKQMGVEIKLTVPKNISLEIKLNWATIITVGAYKNVAISLENGFCLLSNFTGNAQLKTVNGNITVAANKTVSGQAVSERGTVKNELARNEKYTIKAESVNGNISLRQTE